MQAYYDGSWLPYSGLGNFVVTRVRPLAEVIPPGPPMAWMADMSGLCTLIVTSPDGSRLSTSRSFVRSRCECG